MRVVTNHVPREIIDASALSVQERAEFDYLNWQEIDDGTDGASFVRYLGRLYYLGEFMRGGPDGWDGIACDTFFSGVVIRWVKDGDRAIVGYVTE